MPHLADTVKDLMGHSAGWLGGTSLGVLLMGMVQLLQFTPEKQQPFLMLAASIFLTIATAVAGYRTIMDIREKSCIRRLELVNERMAAMSEENQKIREMMKTQGEVLDRVARYQVVGVQNQGVMHQEQAVIKRDVRDIKEVVTGGGSGATPTVILPSMADPEPPATGKN